MNHIHHTISKRDTKQIPIEWESKNFVSHTSHRLQIEKMIVIERKYEKKLKKMFERESLSSELST